MNEFIQVIAKVSLISKSGSMKGDSYRLSTVDGQEIPESAAWINLKWGARMGLDLILDGKASAILDIKIIQTDDYVNPDTGVAYESFQHELIADLTDEYAKERLSSLKGMRTSSSGFGRKAKAAATPEPAETPAAAPAAEVIEQPELEPAGAETTPPATAKK
jgi:hypothetical protein